MKPLLSGIVIVLFVEMYAISQPAWAYLDPASGSMIVQLALGGSAGVIVALKLCWKRFANRVFGQTVDRK